MSAGSETDAPWSDVSRITSFVEQLDEGGIAVSDLVEGFDLPVDVEGVVYHDRGIRIPGYDATFYREPRGSRGVPAFGVEVDAVGPRSAWELFDAGSNWDVYLLTGADVAAIAWMSDGEFENEEAQYFASKAEAVRAGRFSFGIFLPEAAEWKSQVRSLNATRSPAFLAHEDGTTTYPRNESEFFEYVGSTPEEFRMHGNAPSYLGVVELAVSIAET